GDEQLSEADESVRVYQNLNTLIGELALAKSGQLSPGIPCLLGMGRMSSSLSDGKLSFGHCKLFSLGMPME
ncbi:hypothetical protein, partial [Methylacidiphilum sp. Yel]|uniref:hypothetical protein n=1 Tax=Methylacidiphilum sp. Yel TaxID=1847730 RepID=UPI00141B7BDC